MQIIISKQFPSATCQRTGRSDVECVRVTAREDGIKDGVISFRELQNLIRFRQAQENQQENGQDDAGPSLPFGESTGS